MQDNVRLVYEFSQRASKIYHREWLQIQISLYGEFASVSDWFTICFNLCIALLSRNNFDPGKGVLDKLYRQPCLFRKYFAVSSVSHYCWWSLFPDRSGRSFGTGLWRTQKTMNILFNWSDRRWPETKRGEDKGEEGGKITSFRPIFQRIIRVCDLDFRPSFEKYGDSWNDFQTTSIMRTFIRQYFVKHKHWNYQYCFILSSYILLLYNAVWNNVYN